MTGSAARKERAVNSPDKLLRRIHCHLNCANHVCLPVLVLEELELDLRFGEE
eukprot:CAMPEP_0117615896 /NCGR_PEP_ID=MMETSP0784-20121206/84770_1 /TAXON_ID=39447 /ORGANISM="" /LENGTH=51 /DNA_ID=CAMNT_0005419635 /DNA_START=269 /DNA_END=421 /DNA_ORIENTATION=+